MIPADPAFVNRVAEIVCLNAGDSWIADDGAQDQYRADVEEVIRAINTALEERA